MTPEALGYLVICVIAGLGSLGFGLYQRNKLRASETWQQTTGRISGATIEHDTSADSSEYRVRILYDYVVNQRPYQGTRISFGQKGYLRKKKAQEQLSLYPVNSSVTVFFDPDKADDAVLVRSAPNSTFYLVLGILMLAFAIAIVIACTIQASSSPAPSHS